MSKRKAYHELGLLTMFSCLILALGLGISVPVFVWKETIMEINMWSELKYWITLSPFLVCVLGGAICLIYISIVENKIGKYKED